MGSLGPKIFVDFPRTALAHFRTYIATLVCREPISTIDNTLRALCTAQFGRNLLLNIHRRLIIYTSKSFFVQCKNLVKQFSAMNSSTHPGAQQKYTTEFPVQGVCLFWRWTHALVQH